MESSKATVTRFLDNRREKKGNTYPVKITVYFEGKKKRYKTGVDLTVDEYAKMNQPNLRDDVLKLKRRKIEAMLARAEDAIKKLEAFTLIAFEELYINRKGQSKAVLAKGLF